MRRKLIGVAMALAIVPVALGGVARADGNADPYLKGGIHWPGTGARVVHVLDEVRLNYATSADRNAWSDQLNNALSRWTATGVVQFDVTVVAPSSWSCDVNHPVQSFVEVCLGPTWITNPAWEDSWWDDSTLHVWASMASVGYAGWWPGPTCNFRPTGCVLLKNVIHEIGHALGLAHNFDVCSCGDGSFSVMGYGARPNADDFRNVQALYAHSD